MAETYIVRAAKLRRLVSYIDELFALNSTCLQVMNDMDASGYSSVEIDSTMDRIFSSRAGPPKTGTNYIDVCTGDKIVDRIVNLLRGELPPSNSDIPETIYYLSQMPDEDLSGRDDPVTRHAKLVRVRSYATQLVNLNNRLRTIDKSMYEAGYTETEIEQTFNLVFDTVCGPPEVSGSPYTVADNDTVASRIVNLLRGSGAGGSSEIPETIDYVTDSVYA